MQDFTVCFIGTDETFKLLGIKATISDIAITHYEKGEKVLSFVKPIGFPDKVKPLIQSLQLSNYIIIELTAIDKYFAEVIVAVDLVKKPGIFIVSSKNQFLISQLNDLIKGTSLEKFEIKTINDNKDISSLKQELIEKNAELTQESLVVIDHFFNIKNVGLVVLGFLTGGELTSRDSVFLYPGKKQVQIKSIQCMDKDYKEIKGRARVGLALKNCDIEEIQRGSILSKSEKQEITKLEGKIEKVKYYKDEPKQIIAVNNMLSASGTITDKGIELQSPILKIDPKTILIDPNAKALRIIGTV